MTPAPNFEHQESSGGLGFFNPKIRLGTQTGQSLYRPI